MTTRTKCSALLLAAGLLVTACSVGDPDVPATGSDDDGNGSAGGEITIACSQVEDYCAAMTSQFEAATGIETHYIAMGAGAAIARLDAAQAAPEFDVWAGGQAENHLVAADMGLIANYVSPNAADLDEQYTDPDGVWAGFYTGALGFCSSESGMDALGLEIPDSWDDLLDPALKGQVGMPHPASVGAGYMAMWTVYSLNDQEESTTLDYFQALNQNVLQYGTMSTTAGEMVGRGELATSISLVADCERLTAQGYDLTLSLPAEGTGYEVGAVSMVEGAKNPEGGQAFFDWILTAEWQDSYPDIPTYALPVALGATVAGDAVDMASINLIPWDKRAAADGRDRLIELFTDEIAPAPTA